MVLNINTTYSDIIVILLLFAPSQSVYNHRPRLEPLGNLIYVGKPQYGTPLLHNSINFSIFLSFISTFNFINYFCVT